MLEGEPPGGGHGLWVPGRLAAGQQIRAPLPDPAPPPKHSFWHNLWQVLKTVQARLRFIAILAAVGASIVYWDTLKAHYEKWTRPLFGDEAATSADTEFWCPMHPTIVRDHADKCPICGMKLVPVAEEDPDRL